ncbi:hypothetical protein BT93_L0104 [Corymbia citriodora subsp. variegata]|uniref:Uncharacterized protein n=1 Tax=Corymbia citriodora subsp. variegata TaxID=360336 RepID=A0A8T0CET4_CORYI|nr:hypothetical protein BT93_L0104 [Corymbia citriodora subsp. variegata]
MASKGNQIDGWNPNPFTHPTNGNVMNAQSMTSPEAQAARVRAQEIMAASKNGKPGDGDRLLGRQQNYNSLIPGVASLKKRLLGGEKK